jgi:hypothetical protein
VDSHYYFSRVIEFVGLKTLLITLDTVLLVVLVRNRFFRRVILSGALNLIGGFFLTKDEGEKSIKAENPAKQIEELKLEIAELRSRSEDRKGGLDSEYEVFGTQRKRILESSEYERQMLVDLRKLRVEKLLAGIEAPVISNATLLRESIALNLELDLRTPTKETNLKELFELYGKATDEEYRSRQRRGLTDILKSQLASAASIRRAMINLFVLVNMLLVTAIVFRSEQVLSSKEIILGLYISFATFIVYVYRSSNARALILMAGMEDGKRYHDVEKYLAAIGDRSPSEHDIDVLKLLMVNRMERERNSEHPYELVLKGITNSNILMKGGKISAESKPNPKKDD